MHDLRDLTEDRDSWIERIARPLRRPETLDPTFEARLMAAVRAASARRAALRARVARADAASRVTPRGAEARTARKSLGGWFFRPRTLRVSPAVGLAVAAALAAVVVLASGRRGASAPNSRAPAGPVAVRPAQPDTVRLVQFVLVAPSASRVSLVGDFNNWDPAATPLRPTRRSGGVWTISVPLAVGRHQYAFIVDGTRWMTDPTAPTAVEDDFGVPNSVITVGERVS
jgi:hypothetical protein